MRGARSASPGVPIILPQPLTHGVRIAPGFAQHVQRPNGGQRAQIGTDAPQ